MLLDHTPTDADVAAVERSGGSVGQRLSNIDVLTVTVPENALRGLASRPGVVSVERAREDIVLHDHETTGGAELQWGVDRIDAEAAHSAVPNTGAGTVVAVLDTGLDPDHPEFANRVHPDGVSVAGRTQSPDFSDRHGHGTHVSGIIAAAANGSGVVGVAPDAIILPVQIAKGSRIKDASILAAYDYINGLIAEGVQVHVINMSFGGGAPSNAEAAALTALDELGVTLVSSAGNDSGGAVGYPAAYPNVIAVSSTTTGDTLSGFSSVGLGSDDLAAPGSNIYSTYKDGGYAHMSGTSMASPHVAGAAALAVAGGVVGDVRTALIDSAESIGLDDEEQGAGLVDAAQLVGITTGDDLGNRSPVADAGPDQTVASGQTVALSGSASFDPDGDTLTYAWSSGEANALNPNNTASTVYTPPAAPGTYTVTLTVTDPFGASDSDTVIVTVLDPNATVVNYGVSQITSSRKAKGPSSDVTFVVTVTTSNGTPVAGATAIADVTRVGRTFADMVETTDSAGNAAFTIRRALDEPYSIEVKDVTHPDPSLVWDGMIETYSEPS